MTSRDGAAFHRWSEAVLRPGLRYTDNWVYGDNLAWSFRSWSMCSSLWKAHGAFDPRPEMELRATLGVGRQAEAGAEMKLRVTPGFLLRNTVVRRSTQGIEGLKASEPRTKLCQWRFQFEQILESG